jgi:hypothetical protein
VQLGWCTTAREVTPRSRQRAARFAEQDKMIHRLGVSPRAIDST